MFLNSIGIPDEKIIINLTAEVEYCNIDDSDDELVEDNMFETIPLDIDNILVENNTITPPRINISQIDNTDLVKEIFIHYQRLGGKENIEKFKNYFEMFNAINQDAFCGDPGSEDSIIHKMIVEYAQKNRCPLRTASMFYYAKYIGDQIEANIIFKAINSVISTT